MTGTAGLSVKYELDDGAVAHRIGLIVLDTDETSEQDFHCMLPDDGKLAFYTARVKEVMIPVMCYKTLLSSLMFGIAIALMLPACTEQKRSQGQTDTITPPVTYSYTVTKDESETRMMDSTPPSQGPPTIVRATFPDSSGKTYFNEQVLPKLAENNCVVCHMPGAGYVWPEISYDGLFPFLAMGQAADNNVLMFRIANQRSFSPGQPNHPGGKRCETEDSDPCKTIKAWWELEFGSDFR